MRRHGVRPPRCAGCPGSRARVCHAGCGGVTYTPTPGVTASWLTQSHSVTPTRSRRTRSDSLDSDSDHRANLKCQCHYGSAALAHWQ